MVGIVILNYNNTQDIIACVKSILNNTCRSVMRIVVVDNGSEATICNFVEEALKELSPNSFMSIASTKSQIATLPLFTYLKLPSNVGYARGNNAGCELLRNLDDVKFTMICNSDILFTSDIITPLIDTYEKVNNIGALSPLLYRLDGSIDLSCARSAYEKRDLMFTFSAMFTRLYKARIERKQLLLRNPTLVDNPLVEIGMPSGSCMLFSKTVFEKIEGFDPNTFLYYEEAILYEKLKAIGKINYLIPSVSCIHMGGATTSSTKTSIFLKKCNVESLLYFMSTYMDTSNIILLYIKLTGTANILLLKFMQALKRMCIRIFNLRKIGRL